MGFHTVARGGGLWSRGNNYVSKIFTEIISEYTFVSVACGYNYTVAIDDKGDIWSCGNNTQSQLGLGNNINQNVLTEV